MCSLGTVDMGTPVELPCLATSAVHSSRGGLSHILTRRRYFRPLHTVLSSCGATITAPLEFFSVTSGHLYV